MKLLSFFCSFHRCATLIEERRRLAEGHEDEISKVTGSLSEMRARAEAVVNDAVVGREEFSKEKSEVSCLFFSLWW